MKTSGSFFGPALAILLLAAPIATAVEFTTNTAISASDFSYDGADIVISNCTVTVDGPHFFNSLLITNGGVLTHSFFPNGSTSFTVGVTDEPQTLTGTNPVTLLNSNVFPDVIVMDSDYTITYTNGVDFVQTNLSDGSAQIYRTETSSIPDGATVLVTYNWAYSVGAGLNLTVTNDFNVASGGSINVNGIGYGGGRGGGHGYSSIGGTVEGSGAGYGGNGGASSSESQGSQGGTGYGSLYQPANPGSGGGFSYAGSGGNGGGLVQIVAGGNVSLEGAILANGANATNSRAGGGSGGGVWISAGSMSGGGGIQANGGAGELVHGGGGGGGRISIQCGTNNFTGNLAALGGNGWQTGGAGTIFMQTNGQTGLLLVDNGTRKGASSSVNLPTTADVLISGGAGVLASGSFNPRNLTIATNSFLGGSWQSLFNLNVTGNLTIEAGGAFSVDALGYASGAGTAPGGFDKVSPYAGGGGGHGGYGAAGADSNATGGITYGSQITPTTFGSGGGGNSYGPSFGGSGGGAVQLSVSGTLRVDGLISANGQNGFGTGGGGGAGGSIYIVHCATLTGSGSILANGGNGYDSIGGGGGGGRIAVNASASSFTGTLSAYGGGGANYGGAGTIHTLFGNASALTLDNAGHNGTNTLLQTDGQTSLIIQNGAKGTVISVVNFGSLLVSSNAWLAQFGSGGNLVISGDATFQAGGGILANGSVSGQTGGSGNGGYTPYLPYACGGGGHGGAGGNSISNTAAGGSSGYDNVATPSYNYIGSGGSYSTYSHGGGGGGYVRMTVNGTLQLDGLITANGGDGSGNGGGGGAGGSIYLTTGTFAGNGVIRADGGNGANAYGGGGGGGMIAVYFNNRTFSGALSAYGGSGANWGGAGTIYLKTNNNSHATIIVDNGGQSGATTSYQSSMFNDSFLLNGGRYAFSGGNASFGNLVIGSNSWLIVSNSNNQGGSMNISAANVTVQTGGGISADAAGYSANAGSGAGASHGATPPYFACSGAGHGGYGAAAFSNTIYGGGNYYDIPSSPILAGSGGGSYLPYSTGGKGGGVIQMNLTGTLQVDGTISANGGDGAGSGGGGGSGGGLNLTCVSLSGSGSLTANGGNGANGIGGGGAGGMIYAQFSSNNFSGLMSAYGGGGANFGGAGTIFYRTNSYGQSWLVLDNAGHRGTNTPIAVANHLVVRDGAVACTTSSSTYSFLSVLIASNALLVPTVPAGQGTVNLLVSGNTTIQAGGAILADATGSAQNFGNGHGSGIGVSPYFQCSGAGHGGYGGNAISNSAIVPPAGNTYGSTTQPYLVGSGGGGTGNFSFGGGGGGYVKLIVNGTLLVDGSISANGGNGSGIGGGGGSGGSINLAPGALVGSGTVSANGGNGANLYGGGGGGGRIAIFLSSKTNSINGITVSAYGGGGANYGGAGTIYYGPYFTNFARLILDNGNNAGTNTSFDFDSMDVVVQNMAVGQLTFPGYWTAHNIWIRTNSALVGLAATSSSVLSANNLTIDAGGVLSLDAAGYGPQYGPGNGYISTGNLRGGAGHGGLGGGNPSGFGKAYDSIQTPVSAGSGGASYLVTPYYSSGGSGGGAMTLSVSGILTVDGRLSANGGDGGNSSGGGSGGSLNLKLINKLAGSGVISANGGSTGGGYAGGGAGGRIAMICNSNAFTGQITAFGGNGFYPGGAGTIFTRNTISGIKTLLVDNGGLAGTNTPLDSSFSLPATPFDLNIAGAAVVVPVSPLPLINNLNLAAGSTLTMPVTKSNLVFAVLTDANLAGTVTVDYLGHAQANGPGAGSAVSNQGSGGGYGGAGGDSASGAVGGVTYGSAAQPVDFGSGGGSGFNNVTGGSQGGGAVRISVGGTLTVDGNLSANGNSGWQDDSGGGAGGSIWVTANTLSGVGNISASGGDGDLLNGGGGGGGRIAIYAPTNFFAGTTNVSGGDGASPGQPGTIFLSSVLGEFQVTAQSPGGIVSTPVNSVDLTFSGIVDPGSISSNNFTITSPAGPLPASDVSAEILSTSTVRVSFPTQTLAGDYSIQAGTDIADIFGVMPGQTYTGNFTIVWPTISGMVTDTNGAPVADVVLQPDGGLAAVMTDANGNYSIGVPPGWNGTVTPSLGTLMFVPGSLAYYNVTDSVTNQNYLMVPTIAPSLASSLATTNLSLNWTGISGVIYQAQYSTNLVDWLPYGDAIPGTNGLMQLDLPLAADPQAFFRLSVTQ